MKKKWAAKSAGWGGDREDEVEDGGEECDDDDDDDDDYDDGNGVPGTPGSAEESPIFEMARVHQRTDACVFDSLTNFSAGCGRK